VYYIFIILAHSVVEEEKFEKEDIDQILSRSTVVVLNKAAVPFLSKANFHFKDADGTVETKDRAF
jgi:hypothetical protein